MSQEGVWWVIAAALLATAVIVPVSQSEPVMQSGSGWVDADAPRRIRAISRPIEQAANWPGLGDFLAAVSYIESRGNSSAGSDANNNAARGWFGHRPKSARLSDLGLSVSALKDEPTAVALAAWYGHRCRAYAAPGQVMDWLALRRCWGYPSDVSRTEHVGYKDQFARGLRKAGIDPSFMFERAFPSEYNWPGIGVVLALVGRGD